MATKKILFLDHTAQLGGGELALLALLEGLNRSLFTPTVVLASDGPLTQKVRDLSVEVHIVPLDTKVLNTRKDTLRVFALLKFRSAFAVLAYSFKIAKMARGLNADLIHTNSLKSDIYGGLAGRIASIPSVWHVRDRIDEHYLPPAAVRVFRWLCKTLPNAVIANSQSTLDCLRAHGGAINSSARPQVVVHDGLSSNHHVQVEDGHNVEFPEASSADPGAPIIAVIGRIADWKGQHIFIDAAAQVLRTHPNSQFWIVGAPLFGEYDYERSLHEQVDSLGLKESIHFLGFRKDVANILNAVTVVVHASTIGEPFGLVVIEGMAAARPVVATNGGALPEIIDDGVTGVLVPMGSAGAMATAITGLLNSPEKAEEMGRNARRKVLECFTLSQTARGVEKVYNKVLVAA